MVTRIKTPTTREMFRTYSVGKPIATIALLDINGKVISRIFIDFEDMEYDILLNGTITTYPL